MLFGQAEPETFEVVGQISGIVWHGVRHAGRVAGIDAGQDFEHGSRIADSFGKTPDLVQGRGKGHQSITRHSAVGWLESNAAAQARGLADRTARIGAKSG